MVSFTAISWATHYHRNKRDGSSTQRSFETSPDVWARVSHGNVNHQTFVSTLSTLPTPFLLVPGEEKNVQLLHHGLLHASQVGGTVDAVFIHGNLSESPFKMIPIQDITTPLTTSTAGRTRADPFSHSPSLLDMCNAVSAETFAALPPGDNKILQGHPNHFLIDAIHFLKMNGRRTFPAAELAISIISSTLRLPDENDENRERQDDEDEDDDDDGLEQEKDQIKESRDSHESLLAYLWTISQSNAPPIRLADPPEDPTLGGRIQEIRSKLMSSDPGRDQASERQPMRDSTRDLDTLAVATQGLISTLASIDKDRQEHRREDQAEKSVLRNLGPLQLQLFKRLSTTNFNVPGEYTPTMQRFTQEKSAVKAANQMAHVSRGWLGTFSLPAFQRFITNGYESSEKSASNPGGFTIFMCYSSVDDRGLKPLDQDESKIRDLLGLEQTDEIVKYLAKKSYAIASNPDHLKIQIQTYHDLLEQLTCIEGIALPGLAYILDHFDKNVTTFAEMYARVPNFGAKFLYAIDRSMQFFFTKVQNVEHVHNLSNHTREYLFNRATDLMDGILESRAPVDVVLPACLMIQDKPSSVPPASHEHPAKKRGPVPVDDLAPSKSRPILNESAVSAWKIPSGKTYGELFHPRSGNLKDWPVFNANGKQKPMCIRFQSKSQCTSICTLSHPNPSTMDTGDWNKVNQRFSDVYRASN
jgi:hypothetical protein